MPHNCSQYGKEEGARWPYYHWEGTSGWSPLAAQLRGSHYPLAPGSLLGLSDTQPHEGGCPGPQFSPGWTEMDHSLQSYLDGIEGYCLRV